VSASVSSRTVAVRGHPVHPIIIPFPVVLLSGALPTHPVSRGHGRRLLGDRVVLARMGRSRRRPSCPGTGLSMVTARIVAVTGWYGGTLSSRHGIGVTGQGSGEHRHRSGEGRRHYLPAQASEARGRNPSGGARPRGRWGRRAREGGSGCLPSGEPDGDAMQTMAIHAA